MRTATAFLLLAVLGCSRPPGSPPETKADPRGTSLPDPGTIPQKETDADKVRAALKANLDDPADMEILDSKRVVWRARKDGGNPRPDGNPHRDEKAPETGPEFVSYEVRVRCRNRMGGKEIQVWSVNFGTGKDIIQCTRLQ